MIKRISEFSIGAVGYYLIELIWRSTISSGDVHHAMLFLGGFAFLFICVIDDYFKVPMVLKAILSGLFITIMELVIGLFCRYVTHHIIWTYGTADFYGLISATWSLLWCTLSFLALLLRHLLLKKK